jgi:hypothetical protein
MPFLERGEQGVPDHMVEGCFAGVILHGCGEQGVECRRAGRYGAFSSHSAERFDGVGEKGWMARGGQLGPPGDAGAGRGKQPVDALGCVDYDIGAREHVRRPLEEPIRDQGSAREYQVDAGVGSLTPSDTPRTGDRPA